MLNQQWTHRILILVVLLFTAWLRMWQLPEVPPGFFFDEAYNAMDTVWMLETRSPQIFFADNNGREPMYHFLAAFSVSLLGATPLAFRLVSAFTGIITIPLVYRWVTVLFANHPERRWLALMAATTFAFSFWHVLISRTAFRTILLPPFIMLTAWLFWYGWQKRSWLHLIMAGIVLGLSQYTYLPARLLPVLFGFFALIWIVAGKKQKSAYTLAAYSVQEPAISKVTARLRQTSDQQAIIIALAVMALISFTIFLPLGLFFLNNPTAFLMRSDQVFIWNSILQEKITLGEHLLKSLGMFVIARDLEWRVGLVGHLSFGWANTAAFLVGLIVAARHFRQSNYLFLLTGLSIFWIPALLSNEPVSAIRLSGILPFYYTMAALGFVWGINLINRRLVKPPAAQRTTLAVFALVFMINLWNTSYDYFVRWAKEADVYKGYHGPLVDLAQYLITESRQADILLPFNVYSQPTFRFMLYNQFDENTGNVPEPVPGRPVIFVDAKPQLNPWLYRVNSNAYVWLTRDEFGRGTAHISRQQPSANFTLTPTGESVPFPNRYTGDMVALLTPLETIEPALPLFKNWPDANPVNYNWNHQFQLLDYQILPDRPASGHSVLINLYWQLATTAQYDEYEILAQLVNQQGAVVGRTTITTKELFRWRERNAVISAQRSIDTSSLLAPGSYSLQLSLRTGGEFVPVYTPEGELLDNPVTLGTFHIIEDDTAPQPSN